MRQKKKWLQQKSMLQQSQSPGTVNQAWKVNQQLPPSYNKSIPSGLLTRPPGPSRICPVNLSDHLSSATCTYFWFNFARLLPAVGPLPLLFPQPGLLFPWCSASGTQLQCLILREASLSAPHSHFVTSSSPSPLPPGTNHDPKVTIVQQLRAWALKPGLSSGILLK